MTHVGCPSRSAGAGQFLVVRLAARDDDAPPVTRDGAPSITAVLKGGPLGGSRIAAETVQGRPPGTIDAPAGDGTTCRYCLAEWAQSGPSAKYDFLYLV